MALLSHSPHLLPLIASEAVSVFESLIPPEWSSEDPLTLDEFIRQAWPIVEPQTPLSWNWHLDELCDVLTRVTSGEIKRLIINIPPGFAKSLIVSVFWPAWEWSFLPSLRYLTASYSDVNTIRDNRRMRTIVTSDWYRRRYNVELSSDQSGKIRFDNTSTGWRIATSVGGMGTGEHPDRIIVDDPLKAQDARSDVAIQAANDWTDGVMSTRIARDPSIIVIMQRLHLNDVTAHLLQKGGWSHLCLPMWYPDYSRVDPLRRDTWAFDCDCHGVEPDSHDHRYIPGTLLWPEKWGEEKVCQEAIDLGPFGSSSQLGQRPVPEGGGLFKREWFLIVDTYPRDLPECRGWDTAETDAADARKKKRGDWTVGVKMAGPDRHGIYYICDVVREQRELVDSLILDTARLDGHRCKIREGAGSGKAVTKARSVLLAGFDYGTSPETDDKVTRASPFRSQCEMGNVRMVRGPWNEAYLSVVTSFPVGKFDDDVDASSNAANELLGTIRKGKATWGR